MDIYGRKGEPLTIEEYARLLGDMEYKRVAYDEIPLTTKCPASYLSTVWLGLDHNFLLKGPPLIFETMRFAIERADSFHPMLDFPAPDDPSLRIDQERYSTEEQASLGHSLILRLIQEKEMQ